VKHPVCDDRFHDARRRDDVTNKNREPCETCGGSWVDFGMARYDDEL